MQLKAEAQAEFEAQTGLKPTTDIKAQAKQRIKEEIASYAGLDVKSFDKMVGIIEQDGHELSNAGKAMVAGYLIGAGAVLGPAGPALMVGYMEGIYWIYSKLPANWKARALIAWESLLEPAYNNIVNIDKSIRAGIEPAYRAFLVSEGLIAPGKSIPSKLQWKNVSKFVGLYDRVAIPTQDVIRRRAIGALGSTYAGAIEHIPTFTEYVLRKAVQKGYCQSVELQPFHWRKGRDGKTPDLLHLVACDKCHWKNGLYYDIALEYDWDTTLHCDWRVPCEHQAYCVDLWNWPTDPARKNATDPNPRIQGFTQAFEKYRLNPLRDAFKEALDFVSLAIDRHRAELKPKSLAESIASVLHHIRPERAIVPTSKLTFDLRKKYQTPKAPTVQPAKPIISFRDFFQKIRQEQYAAKKEKHQQYATIALLFASAGIIAAIAIWLKKRG
jgi:hypothetical protein